MLSVIRMPELGPMMRALELQRLIEDKVSEWRERSARVAGASVADSYHQPLNFKRHTNRRKNSAEINRIISKYSKPNKRADERYPLAQTIPEIAPTRPVRHKKTNLKLSKSEDNLANIGTMDSHPDPTEVKPPPRQRFNLAKYNAKSYEDITAFVDVHHIRKSKIFEENSILNSKIVKNDIKPKPHIIGEHSLNVSEFSDSGLEIRSKSCFATSTPLSKRKTCPVGDSVSVNGFDKCSNYNASELRKGSSEPDILSVNSDRDSVGSLGSVGTMNTLNTKKRWKLLKPPFRKGAFDCLLRWRVKKPKPAKTR